MNAIIDLYGINLEVKCYEEKNYTNTDKGIKTETTLDIMKIVFDGKEIELVDVYKLVQELYPNYTEQHIYDVLVEMCFEKITENY